MDILSHGLWGGVGAVAANTKKGMGLKPKWAIFWGAFPDLFAFTPAFIFIAWSRLVLHQPFIVPRPDAVEPPPAFLPLNALSHQLYSLSHSFIIFGLVFGLVYLLRRKRAPWEMLAWGFHILSDIPTHTTSFYPTPFLWPLSSFHVDGFSWGQPWFIVLDYSLLLIVYLLVRNHGTKKPTS